MLLEDVVDRLHQTGAVTDQAMAAAAGQAVHRPRHGEDPSLHDKSRASVRQDAIIAHEFEEGVRGSHEAAVEHAPDTKLRIKEEARQILKAQRERSV